MERDKDTAIMRGLQEWREKEQRLGDYFSPAAMKSREALQLKLDNYRDLNRRHSGGNSLLLGVLRAEIKGIERHLHPNWLVRQMERLSYNAGRVFGAAGERLKPRVVAEKPAALKVAEAKREVRDGLANGRAVGQANRSAQEPAKAQSAAPAKQQDKEPQQLKVNDVLRVADLQKEKRQLLKKEHKIDLLPKKNKQKAKNLSVR